MIKNMIKEHLQKTQPSSTLQINELSQKLLEEGKKVYKFGLGQSPFPVPKVIVEALQNNAHQKDYLNVSGLLELREAVSEYHSTKNKYNYKSDNIIIGPGSKELLFQCQMVTDCSLILPSPSWVSYEPQAKFLKKEVFWLPTNKEDNWHLTSTILKNHCQKVNNQNKMLILNSPNNPTGTVNEDLKNIANICRENNILVISDEIYSELNFSGIYNSITHFYPEGTIISSGLSKWCGAGGWRLGTLTFPEELRNLYDKIRSLASETFTSVSAPIQYAAIKAYSDDHSQYLNNSRLILEIVGDYVYRELNNIGVLCLKPQGGFYMLCDFSIIIKKNNSIKNSTDFCKKILKDIGFAMLPGINFGIKEDQLITRIAFVDFDGRRALEFLDQNSKITKANFEFLFPKIIEGINKLKNWIQDQ